jgi:hypothetical protein
MTKHRINTNSRRTNIENTIGIPTIIGNCVFYFSLLNESAIIKPNEPGVVMDNRDCDCSNSGISYFPDYRIEKDCALFE